MATKNNPEFHADQESSNQEVDQETVRQLNRRRGSIKCRLTNFRKFVKSFEGLVLSDSQRTELNLRMQGAQAIFDDFSEVNNKLESIISDDELETLFENREEFENDYYGIIAQTQCMVKCAETAIESKTIASNSLAQSVRLPTISLPFFDGSYEHWLQFRDTFSSLVHNSQEISNIQKFHYLKSSLRGNAQLVIDSLEFSADNYTIAWELLLNRYDNSRLLVHNHVKALFSLQSLTKESPTLLRKLIDTVLKNLRALKLLGEPTESWGTLINYLVVSKLDPTTEREWEQYKSTLLPVSNDSKSALNVDDLLKFVRDRADMLETLLVTHSRSGSSSNTHVTHPQHDAKKPYTYNAHAAPKLHCNIVTDKRTDKSHTKQAQFKKLCAMCNDKHPLYSCQAFINLSLHDKLKLVRDKQLCENCLRAGHSSGDCRYGPCRRCNKKHNSIIHEDEKEGDSDKRSVSLLALDNASRPPASSASILDNNIAHAHHTMQVTNAHLDINAQGSSVQPVLLSTALVDIRDSSGNYHRSRAILDSGSECSIMTQALCDKLKPLTIQSIQQIRGVSNSITHCSKKCEIEISSLVDNFKTRIQCLVLPQLTTTLPTFTIKRNQFRIPDNVRLADPTFYECQSVDLLIGAGLFWDLLVDGKMRLVNGPFLQNTKFGWIISGPVYSNTRGTKPIHCNFTQSLDTQSLDNQLRRFWEIEEVHASHKSYDSRNEDEIACEDHFVKTTTRLEDGRFCVQMPLKEPPEALGDSFAQAKRRFMSLEKRLNRDPMYKSMYSDFIKEYLALGHMKRVYEYGTPNFFFAHHGILRLHALTTRLRIVFDGSASSTSGKSLNDLQLVGPPIQGDLIAILLRFRENRFVACADIEKHYRQVRIDESQRDLQLILWRNNSTDKLEVYQLGTITYGTASGAYLACRCLKQLALECTDPEVARTIKDDFYVDDLITGSTTTTELQRICKETAKVLSSGCFPLRKWVFNFDCTNQCCKDDSSKELTLGEHAHSKTLGIGWYNKSDELHYHTRHEPSLKPVTKRVILSTASQVFDPLGLLSPMITIAKCLLQRLFLLKLEWDAVVPDDVTQTWHRFVDNLSLLPNIRIPRHVMCNNNPVCIELHLFSDASQLAYGSCAYVRTLDSESAVTVRLLCAKAKVAPIAPSMSIPKLELSGGLISARLYNKIKESLRSKFDRVIFWTDSTIVLGWLRMQPNLLKPYVQNRVAEIHELTQGHSWHHVSGKDNPADLVSRGAHLDTLINSNLWWNGPKFLYDANYVHQHLDLSLLPDESQLPERKSNPATSLVCNNNNDSLFTFSRFSQFNRMQRAAAYVLRFIYNARNKHASRSGALMMSELRESETLLARLSQIESFPDAYDALVSNKNIAKGFLEKLNLFIDDNKVIRVGGRLTDSLRFDYNKKHPVLLSSKHHFTTLLFRFEHRKLLHAGPQHILFSLRETWWPISGRNLARKVVHNCVTCARFRGKTLAPIMGNLPPERLEPGFVFMNCAVDYGGPYLILNRKGRGATTTKAYLCIFICFSTRAVHLELVTDMSSDAYLLALKRFISRRGKPSKIFSDNGRNFVGLMNDFARFLNSCSSEIKEYATSQKIEFIMMPPYASHFAGLVEAGVKSCKHHLRRVIGDVNLTYEEFSTVLAQVEAILNSRPLSPMSSDPRDYTPLSPAHFLVGRPLTVPVCTDLIDAPAHRLSRYQRVEQIRQHFWARWSKEYVSELQVRTKWTRSKGELKQDTLVLIKEDHAPPLKWSLGRITQTFPGRDGVSRVADIRTDHGTVRRAFSKICPLPINDD